jgi:hypothetical protein
MKSQITAKEMGVRDIVQSSTMLAIAAFSPSSSGYSALGALSTGLFPIKIEIKTFEGPSSITFPMSVSAIYKTLR